LRWYESGDLKADSPIGSLKSGGRPKGFRHTAVTKERISASKIGKPRTDKPWNKGKIFEAVRGANHYNWKGGITSERKKAMNGIEYSEWRRAVFQRDNYTCQICDQYGVNLNADHIQSWVDYPELRYDPSNGRALCVPCHYYVTFKRKMPHGNKWLAPRKAG
jgi:hypothetical protein